MDITRVTDFKLVSTSFITDPHYHHDSKLESLDLKCPGCGEEFWKFNGEICACVSCNAEMVNILESNPQDDDIIESRFDILDL